MLVDGAIDPRRFTPEHMADEPLADLARRITLVPDGNEDPNALFPQRLTVTFADGRRDSHEIAHTLGSPGNPLTPAQAQAKQDLARELAPHDADPRIFDDPLAYFTGQP
jgi:2-methylcitrate dehydratase PrpD